MIIIIKPLFLPGFDDHIRSLKPRVRTKQCDEEVDGVVVPRRNCRNVWFKEFWTRHFNCTFREEMEGRKICSGEETLHTEQEGLVPFVGG